jgi:hypothetical protein
MRAPYRPGARDDRRCTSRSVQKKDEQTGVETKKAEEAEPMEKEFRQCTEDDEYTMRIKDSTYPG